MLVACVQKGSSIVLPDARPLFTQQLFQRDPSLLVDSFYFVGLDTMTQKSTLFHQRFPYLHILGRLVKEIDSLQSIGKSSMSKLSQNDLARLKTMEEEKICVTAEVDSINREYESADSIAPTGYRVINKVTVRKQDVFSVSDSIAYALSTRMVLSDWDRNIDRALDSLAIGKHVLRGPFTTLKGQK